jgi:hypothetical protein
LLFEPIHHLSLVEDIIDLTSRGNLKFPVNVFGHDAARALEILDTLPRGLQGPKIILTICGLDEIILDTQQTEAIQRALRNFLKQRPNLIVLIYGSAEAFSVPDYAQSILPACYLLKPAK